MKQATKYDKNNNNNINNDKRMKEVTSCVCLFFLEANQMNY